MALEQQLTDTLTQAIKAKDGRTSDVVRMIKTKIQERRTAKGASGHVDDALVLEVIGAYRKQLQKALTEYDKAGEKGAAQAAVLRFEIEFCERYLPKTMDEGSVRALVKERIVGVYSGPDFRVRYGNGDEAMIVSITFACRALGGEPRVNDDESLELRYFPPDALPPMETRHAMRNADALRTDPRARFRR